LPKKEAGVQIPADLSTLTADELSTLEKSVLGEFDSLTNDPELTAEGLAQATSLGENIEAIRVESAARVAAAEELAAGREALKSRIKGDTKDDDDEEKAALKADDEEKNERAETEEAVTASGRKSEPIIKSGNKLNVRLSEAQKHAPAAKPGLSSDFDASVLVASADIPGFTTGGRIENMADLVRAYQQRARALPVGRANASGRAIEDMYLDSRTGDYKFGVVANEGDWRNANRIPIAQLQRQFRHILDTASTPQQAWDVMQEAANPSSLVAAGGWCSPSEIRYDFYNIVAMDGAVDLPTAGINRGGVRFPTSPSFGDLAASTGLWHWTELQDIAAATGGGAGLKTCARIPCASMNEVRLEGEGVCITAGNLTTDAWPEQLSNFLRLVNAAHFHRVNSYFIAQLIAQSTAVTLTPTAATSAAANLLATVEHQAWDLRTKYAMADTDVLEVIMPSWVKGIVRADISRRNGLGDNPDAVMLVSDAEMAAWFTQRNISVQFVQDFDVRTTGQFGLTAASTAWPTLFRFLIYPAGTWLRGNGLNLDLGVIRDSTLNATNDYTAAWSEEFFLLAKIGHESRIVTVAGFFPNGASGAQVANATTV
jgi:hypothetical protein